MTVELRATGTTLPEAFARIGLALFATAVDPATVEDADVREVRAHGSDVPMLLRAWLQECLYVHEVEGFACRALEFMVFDAAPATGGETMRLHAVLRGEAVDFARHRVRPIRNVLLADMAQAPAPAEPFSVRATLDA